jgi:hypothetical protein
MFRLSGVVELSVPVVTYTQLQAGTDEPHT